MSELNDVLRQHATPVKLGRGYVLMLCEFDVCGECKRLMVPKAAHSHVSVFPKWNEIDLAHQVKRGDLVFRGGVKNKKDEPICESCAAEGKATFVCYLCKREWPSSEIKETYGDPPDYLCKPCFLTVPAVTWLGTVDELYAAHRYDYE